MFASPIVKSKLVFWFVFINTSYKISILQELLESTINFINCTLEKSNFLFGEAFSKRKKLVGAFGDTFSKLERLRGVLGGEDVDLISNLADGSLHSVRCSLKFLARLSDFHSDKAHLVHAVRD